MAKRPAKSKRAPNAKAPKPPGRKAFISPWRSSYIFGPKKVGCFFCEASALNDGDEKAWKEMLLLHRGAHGLVIMNRYPYTGGHLLVAPRRHTADLPRLTAEESVYMWEYTRRAVDVIDKIVHAQGYNIGMNLGRSAGAGVEDHLHMHALPRWQGDTNFMHIVGGTSTVPVSLELVWDQMRELFKAYS